jgi:hypothetical protein
VHHDEGVARATVAATGSVDDRNFRARIHNTALIA